MSKWVSANWPPPSITWRHCGVAAVDCAGWATYSAHQETVGTSQDFLAETTNAIYYLGGCWLCWMGVTRNCQTQVKVSWQKLPTLYTTWEELDSIHRLHPVALAWGHVASQGGRIVTTLLAREAIRKERRERKQAEMRLAWACRAAREKPNPTSRAHDWRSSTL